MYQQLLVSLGSRGTNFGCREGSRSTNFRPRSTNLQSRSTNAPRSELDERSLTVLTDLTEVLTNGCAQKKLRTIHSRTEASCHEPLVSLCFKQKTKTHGEEQPTTPLLTAATRNWVSASSVQAVYEGCLTAFPSPLMQPCRFMAAACTSGPFFGVPVISPTPPLPGVVDGPQHQAKVRSCTTCGSAGESKLSPMTWNPSGVKL